MTYDFHADLTPPEPGTDNQRKRVIFNFANGRSASLVLMASAANRSHHAAVASWITADPDNADGFELGQQEATAEEAAAWLHTIAGMPPI